jgi:hypothetical protein
VLVARTGTGSEQDCSGGGQQRPPIDGSHFESAFVVDEWTLESEPSAAAIQRPDFRLGAEMLTPL